MDLKDFYYDLPEELIAQEPIDKRNMSRLLVLGKKNGEISHRNFEDIAEYLKDGDCLVLNDTRVIPARLLGIKKDTSGSMEFLLLNKREKDTWEVMVRPGRKAKPGSVFTFGSGELEGEILDIAEGGNRIVKFRYEGFFEEVLDKLGIIPLPPYIKKTLEDKERYQTVYSKYKGSAAAPTAGLHFTKVLLEQLSNIGVQIAFLTLHVGLGTFRPVKVRSIEEHKMHKEYYVLDAENAGIVNKARENKGKVICVGTTSARTLESIMQRNGKLIEDSGWTDIFIYPGYEFLITDGLITNFHLPESTLLMLVSAIAGRDSIMKAYKEAIEKRYRFFSFGDAMLII